MQSQGSIEPRVCLPASTGSNQLHRVYSPAFQRRWDFVYLQNHHLRLGGWSWKAMHDLLTRARGLTTVPLVVWMWSAPKYGPRHSLRRNVKWKTHEKRTHEARWNSSSHPHSLVTNTKTPPLSPEHIPVVPNIIITIHNTHIIKFRGEPSLKVPVKRKWYGKYRLYSEKQRNGQYIFSAINPFFPFEITSMCHGNL